MEPCTFPELIVSFQKLKPEVFFVMSGKIYSGLNVIKRLRKNHLYENILAGKMVKIMSVQHNQFDS